MVTIPRINSSSNSLDVYKSQDAEYQAARAKTKELVVCSGGDGTLNEVVSGLMTITPEKRPELGYIPSGSTTSSFVFARAA